MTEPRMARLNITVNGQQGDLPDLVSYDMTDTEIFQVALESVRQGYVPGIDAIDNPSFANYRVDRFPARDDVPYNRLSLRPKTEYGARHGLEQDILHVIPPIGEADAVTASEIMNMLGCSRGHTYRILRDLEARQLVRVRFTNQSVCIYDLTMRGMEAYLTAVGAW